MSIGFIIAWVVLASTSVIMKLDGASVVDSLIVGTLSGIFVEIFVIIDKMEKEKK